MIEFHFAVAGAENRFEFVDESLAGTVIFEVIDVGFKCDIVGGVVRLVVFLDEGVRMDWARGVTVGFKVCNEVLVVDVIGLS